MAEDNWGRLSDREKRFRLSEKRQERAEKRLSEPAGSLREAISRVPSQMGRNIADRVSQEFGTLGSATVAAIRTPGARYQAFKREVSQGIRGAIADALGSGQIGRYLADKVRGGIRYDKDPQKNFERLRSGLIAASQDFQQIKGTISSVNKQNRELSLAVKQVAEKVNRIEREQSIQQRLIDQLKQAADENKPRVSGLSVASNDNDKVATASQIDSLLSGAIGGALSRIPFSRFAKFGAWGLAAYAGYKAAQLFDQAAKNAPKETEKQARQAEQDLKSGDPKQQTKGLGDLARAQSLPRNSQTDKAIADAIKAGVSVAKTPEEAAITGLVADYQRATTTQEKEVVLSQLSAHDYKTVQSIVSRFQVLGLMNDLDRYNGNKKRDLRKQQKSLDQYPDESIRRKGWENRSNDDLEKLIGIKKEKDGSVRISSSSPNTIYLDSSKIVVEGDLIVKGKVKVDNQPDWAQKAFNPDDNSPTAPRSIRQRRYTRGRAGAIQAPGVFGKASSITLAERYAQMGTNMEKQQFLAYGQLPRGFENVPGHMGILGSPGAVMARGAMPLGQFGGGGTVGGYGGMPSATGGGGGYNGSTTNNSVRIPSVTEEGNARSGERHSRSNVVASKDRSGINRDATSASSWAGQVGKTSLDRVPEGYSPWMAKERKKIFDQLDGNPKLKALVLSAMMHEDSQNPHLPLEAFANRMAARQQRIGPSWTIERELRAFYGPVQRGEVSVRKINPAMEEAYEKVKRGSKDIGYYTDQGMRNEHAGRKDVKQIGLDWYSHAEPAWAKKAKEQELKYNAQFKGGQLEPLPTLSLMPREFLNGQSQSNSQQNVRPTDRRVSSIDSLSSGFPTAIGNRVTSTSGTVKGDIDLTMTPEQFFGPNAPQLPAGLRVSNNPGNLKYSGSSWQQKNLFGMMGPSKQTDEGTPQIQFTNIFAGMASAARLALAKQKGDSITINQLIAGQGGWTPGYAGAAENVAKFMGVKPNEKIDLRNAETMQKFLKAIVRQEHGGTHNIPNEVFQKGASLGIAGFTQGREAALSVKDTGQQTNRTSSSMVFTTGSNSQRKTIEEIQKRHGKDVPILAQGDTAGIVKSLQEGKTVQLFSGAANSTRVDAIKRQLKESGLSDDQVKQMMRSQLRVVEPAGTGLARHLKDGYIDPNNVFVGKSAGTGSGLLKHGVQRSGAASHLEAAAISPQATAPAEQPGAAVQPPVTATPETRQPAASMPTADTRFAFPMPNVPGAIAPSSSAQPSFSSESQNKYGYGFPLSTGTMMLKGHGRTSEFGYGRGRLHAGVDLYAVDPLTRRLLVNKQAPVFAPSDGKITAMNVGRGVGTANRAGNWIEYQDQQGHKFRFLHTEDSPINPATGKPWKVGDSVTKGSVVTHVTGSGTDFGRAVARNKGDYAKTVEEFNKRGWGGVNMPHLHLEVRDKSGRLLNPGQVFSEFSGKEKTKLFGNISAYPTQATDESVSTQQLLESYELNKPLPLQNRGIMDIANQIKAGGQPAASPQTVVKPENIAPSINLPSLMPGMTAGQAFAQLPTTEGVPSPAATSQVAGAQALPKEDSRKSMFAETPSVAGIPSPANIAQGAGAQALQPELPPMPVMPQGLPSGAEGINAPSNITGLPAEPTGLPMTAGIPGGPVAGETVPGAETAPPVSAQASTAASAGSDGSGGGGGSGGAPGFRNHPESQAASPGSQGLGSFGKCYV